MTRRLVGYSDRGVFFGMVFAHSCFPHEDWRKCIDRLCDAIQHDADALGVRAELSPARVTYAYRHHPSLRLTEAQIEARIKAGKPLATPPPSAQEALAHVLWRVSIRQELESILKKKGATAWKNQLEKACSPQK